ncbi:MAG: peptidase T [Lachnospiraceae bacterium]|nr:peptidase T [Lachnospiraceae bacterium]
MEDLLQRFYRYVKMDTQSQEECDRVPSTAKQFSLAEQLLQELKDMGIEDASLDKEHCYVYGHIPSNMGEREVPAIGFISHMDTSPAVTGANVNPRLVENYDGGDVLLSKENGRVLSPKDYPLLKTLMGKSIIVTDGNTLLGADDKAGVAEIMSLVQYLTEHPEIPHGTICIGFTPDEEVGNGTAFFDLDTFGAKFAYTVDGGTLGEIEYENFNAAMAKVKILGKSIHPGDAKGKMINAALLAMEFNGMLPQDAVPEKTEGYEGFFYLEDLKGQTELAEMTYIVRDHDKAKFEDKKQLLLAIQDKMNAAYGEGTVTVTLKDQYYNMIELIKPHMHLIENARKAFTAEGVEPVVVAIRGGTDGATLSYKGLPCPNLSTGGYNFHGRYEFACYDDMKTMVQVLINIVKEYSQWK